MIVYVSGPITGVKDYRRKFAEAAQQLLELGHVVINPAEMDSVIKGLDGVPYGVYMNTEIRMLEAADAIAMLPGWENSKGAKAEWLKAVRLGKSVITMTEGHDV